MGKKGPLPKNKLPVIGECVAAPYKPSKEDMERERRFRAEDGLRALTRADEIRGDKQLMSDIKLLAKEQMRTAAKFAK